jgi:hypothetical protein
VRSVTVYDVADDPVRRSGCAVSPTYGVIRYPVIALPPSDTGALQDSATSPSPGTAATFVGAPGTVRGVTAPEAADSGPVPAALIAATLNVYVWPLSSPVIVRDVAGELVVTGVCATAPTYGVIRYPVIWLPPSDTGAVHDTSTEPSPAVPPTAVGAPGTVRGVTAAEAAESSPVPAALVAATVNV